MRVHGTLTRWNDDRGFGFITPAKGPPEIFVHISAFPRDGVRPRVGELISFEVEPGKDGKSRAARIMRPGQKALRPPPAAAARRHAPARGIPRTAGLLLVVGAGIASWLWSARSPEPAEELIAPSRPQLAPTTRAYSCDGRTRCSQMTSCEEATYFLRNCPGPEMDGDRDGVPCESQWCGTQ